MCLSVPYVCLSHMCFFCPTCVSECPTCMSVCPKCVSVCPSWMCVSVCLSVCPILINVENFDNPPTFIPPTPQGQAKAAGGGPLASLLERLEHFLSWILATFHQNHMRHYSFVLNNSCKLFWKHTHVGFIRITVKFQLADPYFFFKKVHSFNPYFIFHVIVHGPYFFPSFWKN